MSTDSRTQTFETPSGVGLSIRIPSGLIRVHADETTQTSVEVEALNDAARELLDRVRADSRPRAERHEVTVEVPERRGAFFNFGSPKFEVRIDCPAGADLAVRTGSADLEAVGRLGDVQVASGSGDVELDHVAGELRAKTASGDISVETVDGEANVQTASGDVEVGRVGGRLDATLVSGDLRVRDAAASVNARTVSGDQSIESVGQGEVNVQAVSGDVLVGVRRGSRLWVDANSVSGSTTSEVELSGDAPGGEGPLLELRARTVSGDFRLVRA